MICKHPANTAEITPHKIHAYSTQGLQTVLPIRIWLASGFEHTEVPVGA